MSVEKLSRLRFKNVGVVSSDMKFEYHDKNCFYVETHDRWSTNWGEEYSYPYLFEARNDEIVDPPSGMRSAVPLGGLGSGTVELRADGSLCDWNIFNNSPAGGGGKVQLKEALFGLRTKIAGENPNAWAIRTHAPEGLPSIEQLEYSGAFPVSRLRLVDSALPIEAELYAYCEFRMTDTEECTTPAVIFSFKLNNPGASEVETSLLFNLPNHIKGKWSSGRGLTLTSEGAEPTSGTMALRSVGEDTSTTCETGSTLQSLWSLFVEKGSFGNRKVESEGEHGAIAVEFKLAPGESRMVSFVMSWLLPHRTHAGEVVGNYYSSLYTSADDVSEDVIGRISEDLEGILEWQTACFDNSLPEWLQDSLINSPATVYKTGFWMNASFYTDDIGWRQFESFSCPNVSPVHIDFYRSIPCILFFPELYISLLKGYAAFQCEDGYICEDLGDNHDLKSSTSKRMMGDGCTGFLLGLYAQYKWTGDSELLVELWPNAKRAAKWQIERSKDFGLPHNLNNTYDWWEFENKEVVAYNAFIHLAAMLAAEKMALLEGDTKFAKVCRDCFDTSKQAVSEKLWTGSCFRAWWFKDQPASEALHADTLYGQLWAFLLDLGLVYDADQMIRHLSAEQERNDSHHGLKVLQGDDQDTSYRDNKIWEAGSLDWCSLNLFLGVEADKSLGMAEKLINKWREKLNDQWDYKDLSAGEDGYPWCNSHYGRQLIMWAIPMALSGQQFSASERSLKLNPRKGKLPFFTPFGSGVVETLEDDKYKFTVLTGYLDIDTLEIGEKTLAVTSLIEVGQSVIL